MLYDNKCSAVPEMTDRGHNRHGPKRGKGCCAPFAGAGTPSSTMWPGARSNFRTKRRHHASSHMTTIDMGQKLGGGGRALFLVVAGCQVRPRMKYATDCVRRLWLMPSRATSIRSVYTRMSVSVVCCLVADVTNLVPSCDDRNVTWLSLSQSCRQPEPSLPRVEYKKTSQPACDQLCR